MSLQERAEELQELGWHALPVKVTFRPDGGKNVQPLINWREPASTGDVSAMPWEHATNIAIVLERSGVAILDVDDMDKLGLIPPEARLTAWQATRKGRHYFYQTPSWRIGRKVRGMPGIDLLSEGLAIIWAIDDHLADGLARWPFSQEDVKEKPGVSFPGEVASLAVPVGARNDDLARAVGSIINENPNIELAELARRATLYSISAHSQPLKADEIAKTAKSILQKHLITYQQAAAAAIPGSMWDMADLVETHFDPIRFICPPFVAEGYTVYAGKPKIGKTTLMRQLIVAASTGGEFLGFPCNKTEGLFLSLEESPRLFRSKLQHMGYKIEELRGINVAFDWPRGEFGVIALDKYMSENPRTKLIIIDSAEAFKGAVGNSRESPLTLDYRAGQLLLEFAKRHPGVAVILIFHARKMASDDPMDLVSGTTGVTASCDTVCVLHKTVSGFNMHWEGRNWFEEHNDYEVSRDSGRWRFIGAADEAMLSIPSNATGQAEIYRIIKQNGPVAGNSIAMSLQISEQAVSAACLKMEAKNLIRREGRKWCVYIESC